MKANQMSQLYPEIIAVALYSYEPNEDDEIPLVQGDSMIVIQQQWDGWWLVKKGDLVGLIPSTHVSLVSATTLTKSCPLPSEWDCCIDEKSGEVYYFNESTGDSDSESFVKLLL